ncbi:MAG: hypothetical protein ABII89_06370 [Candidatus Omnitrophota bacterium]
MKEKRILTWIAVIFMLSGVCFMASAQEAPGTNLVINGSFEKGTSDWNINPSTPPERYFPDDSTSADGEWSLKLDGTIALTTTSTPYFMLADQIISGKIKPSTNYILKADIRRSTARNRIFAAVLERPTAPIAGENWTYHICGEGSEGELNTWEHFELKFTTNPEIQAALIALYNVSSGGIAWFDNIRLEEEKNLAVGQVKDSSARIEVPASGPDLITYIVSPASGIKVLPFDPVVPGEIANEIKIVATPGEYEPASFVLNPKDDLKNLTLTASDLKGAAGTIPASSIDLKVVKCWYQTGINWNSGSFNEFTKYLVPELLLNDDTLVKVDFKKEENYLKLVFPEGEKYLWISDPEEVNKSDGGQLGGWDVKKVDEFPVKDSPALLPVNIPAGTNKQFWVTIKVPEDAKDGVYTGSINLSAGEKTLGAVTLKLRVLPFKLASPKTYYDLTREFTSSIYYIGQLVPDDQKGTIYTILKNKEQLRAELNNMLAHGVTNPVVYQGYPDPKGLGGYLDIRNEVGMGKQPLYYLGADIAAFLGCNFFTGEGLPVPPEKLAALKVRIKEVIDFFKPYGIPEVYFYGQDEARDEEVTAQRPAWETVREAGGKVFVAGYRPGINNNKKGNFELAGDIQDLLVSAGQPVKEEADKWHSVGHKIWCYANPQAGPENPALFRKGFGFGLWKANYDGAATWAYIHFYPPWNDFRTNGKLYSFVYPTVNGVVDTIAWEGYREAIDDIRYGTTLKLLIEKTKKSGAKTEIAREAEEYLNNLDAKDKNPDLIRLEIINYILKLL